MATTPVHVQPRSGGNVLVISYGPESFRRDQHRDTLEPADPVALANEQLEMRWIALLECERDEAMTGRMNRDFRTSGRRGRRSKGRR